MTVTINGMVQSRTWWGDSDVVDEGVDVPGSTPAQLLRSPDALR